MSGSRVPGFLASECETIDAAGSLFHVLPAPFEQSVSYGRGTGDGPRAILEASQQLEAFDGESVPLELGIHTAPFIDCSQAAETVLSRIKQRCAAVMRQRKIPVLLGGEHTVTLGALQAAQDAYPGPIGLFQLDAHADLRDTYEGTPYSHACVARRAHADYGMTLCQFGVRALSSEEQAYRLEHGIDHFDGMDCRRKGVGAFRLTADFPERIYLTLDVDGLDPAVIRATGTPVPGGPGWYETMDILAAVVKNRQVIGFDVVELAPRPDDHASSFAAAQLTYAVMGLIQRHRCAPRN